MQRFLSTVCFLALSAGFSGRCQGEVSTMDSSPGLSELVRGNNEFALALYGRLASGAGNRFISPFSVSCALAMTYSGARGQTAAQIASALHFNLPAAELHPAFHRLITDLHHRNESETGAKGACAVELSTANALWCSRASQSSPNFKSSSKATMKAA